MQVALQGTKHAAKAFSGLTKFGKKEAKKAADKVEDLTVPSMYEGKFKKDEIEAFRKYRPPLSLSCV